MRPLILSSPSPISFSQESFQFCQTSSLLLLDLFQSWIRPDRPACRFSDRSGPFYSTIHAHAICFWSLLRKLGGLLYVQSMPLARTQLPRQTCTSRPSPASNNLEGPRHAKYSADE